MLTLWRLTVDRHNRSNVLLLNRSIKMIVIGELMFVDYEIRLLRTMTQILITINQNKIWIDY